MSRGFTHGASAYANNYCRCDYCTEENRLRNKAGREAREWRLENGFDEGPKVHGAGGYCNWGCRCEVCKKGHNERCKEQAAVRRQKMRDGSPEVPHGTPSGYTAWGCRCDACFFAAKPNSTGKGRHRTTIDVSEPQ